MNLLKALDYDWSQPVLVRRIRQNQGVICIEGEMNIGVSES